MTRKIRNNQKIGFVYRVKVHTEVIKNPKNLIEVRLLLTTLRYTSINTQKMNNLDFHHQTYNMIFGKADDIGIRLKIRNKFNN